MKLLGSPQRGSVRTLQCAVPRLKVSNESSSLSHGPQREMNFLVGGARPGSTLKQGHSGFIPFCPVVHWNKAIDFNLTSPSQQRLSGPFSAGLRQGPLSGTLPSLWFCSAEAAPYAQTSATEPPLWNQRPQNLPVEPKATEPPCRTPVTEPPVEPRSQNPAHRTSLWNHGHRTSIWNHGHRTSLWNHGHRTSLWNHGHRTPCGTPLTEPPCGTTVTEPPCGTTVTEPPCGTTVTEPPYGTTVTEPPCGTTVTEPPYGTTVTEPPYGTTVTEPPCGTTVTEPPCGTTVTEPPCGTTVTAPLWWTGTEEPRALGPCPLVLHAVVSLPEWPLCAPQERGLYYVFTAQSRSGLSPCDKSQGVSTEDKLTRNIIKHNKPHRLAASRPDSPRPGRQTRVMESFDEEPCRELL
ncbi:unnamed protein product [Boreogadus saida]